MRRREPPKPARPGGEVPLWVRQLNYGLMHVTGRPLSTPVNLGEVMPRLRAARAQWCAENGCYRAEKSCREAFGGVPEACRAAGGPAAPPRGEE